MFGTKKTPWYKKLFMKRYEITSHVVTPKGIQVVKEYVWYTRKEIKRMTDFIETGKVKGTILKQSILTGDFSDIPEDICLKIIKGEEESIKRCIE